MTAFQELRGAVLDSGSLALRSGRSLGAVRAGWTLGAVEAGRTVRAGRTGRALWPRLALRPADVPRDRVLVPAAGGVRGDEPQTPVLPNARLDDRP